MRIVVVGLLTEVNDVAGPIAVGSSAEAGADRYKDHGIEGGRLLQGDVSSQGITQAGDEELDLQWLG
jgi:hypothetical protein